jgi:hypothetical protein
MPCPKDATGVAATCDAMSLCQPAEPNSCTAP